MSEFVFINKARTVAISGHRVLEKDFNKELLTKKLKTFVDNGFDTFLIGMALGFDTACFNALEEIRKEKNIKLIACIPCPSQAYKFTVAQKKEYDRMLSVSDEKILISESYTPTCMMKRNKFMVDNATGLFAYYKRDYGGTANTVKYAMKKGVPIITFD